MSLLIEYKQVIAPNSYILLSIFCFHIQKLSIFSSNWSDLELNTINFLAVVSFQILVDRYEWT